MGRTALELVGQGGLGHSFDPLTEETSDEYTEAVKALVYVFVFSHKKCGWLTYGTHLAALLSTLLEPPKLSCPSSSTWALHGCAARCSTSSRSRMFSA